MERLSSILVVIERDEASHQALTKAYMLARHFGARLELFLCDAEHAYALRHAYDSRGVAEAREVCLADGRRYLEALRQSVAAEDISITVDVACESPQYEGIVHKVLRSCPDLVVKATAPRANNGVPLSATDWHLARTCPVPLLLARRRPWSPQPRIAAAVDLSPGETPGLARAIARTGEFLARGCHGRLELVFSERGADVADARRGASRQPAAMAALAADLHLSAEQLCVLCGDPQQALPAFAAERNYDAIVIGALSHRSTLAALVGTLTGTLMEAVDCDFVLVKPGTYSSPVREAQPAAGA